MILSLALVLAAATPVETIARSMEDYTQCLREYAGAGPLDRRMATERGRSAVAQCSDRREATIQLAIHLLSPELGADRTRERMEQAIAELDAMIPEMLVAGGGVDIPHAIGTAVRRYSDCLGGQMLERNAMANLATYRVAADASIAACIAVRTEAIAESEALLSSAPEYRDPARRQAAIQRAFDGVDSQQRNFPELLEAIARQRETNASN
jgi:hypothetical protein